MGTLAVIKISGDGVRNADYYRMMGVLLVLVEVLMSARIVAFTDWSSMTQMQLARMNGDGARNAMVLFMVVPILDLVRVRACMIRRRAGTTLSRCLLELLLRATGGGVRLVIRCGTILVERLDVQHESTVSIPMQDLVHTFFRSFLKEWDWEVDLFCSRNWSDSTETSIFLIDTFVVANQAKISVNYAANSRRNTIKNSLPEQRQHDCSTCLQLRPSLWSIIVYLSKFDQAEADWKQPLHCLLLMTILNKTRNLAVRVFVIAWSTVKFEVGGTPPLRYLGCDIVGIMTNCAGWTYVVVYVVLVCCGEFGVNHRNHHWGKGYRAEGDIFGAKDCEINSTDKQIGKAP